MPLNYLGQLMKPAFKICLLGSISALLSAEVTDGMIGVRHNSNRELIGQGLGNLVSSLIGGLPVSGAVARSGVNVHSGGRTRLSSILHAIFLLLMVLVFAPLVKRIPLASLAAILMVASVRSADWKSLRLIPGARWRYGVIMMITTTLTVVKDLTVAVVVGAVLAGIGVLIELASSPQGKVVNRVSAGTSVFTVHPAVEVITFEGPLFFVGAEKMRRFVSANSEKALLVLDFSNVTLIDETGALALRDLLLRLQREGKNIYLGGLQRAVVRILIRMGVVDSLGQTRVYRRLEGAIRRASAEACNSRLAQMGSAP
jgi:SulP family sulfate permease